MQITNDMKTTFTSTERVLFNANFNFWIQNGLSETEATERAMNKIIQTRSLAKTLKFKH
jgi:predicted CoA-binding protein